MILSQHAICFRENSLPITLTTIFKVKRNISALFAHEKEIDI